MITVTQLPDEQYMMTYECGGCPAYTGTAYQFPVYHKINSNPLLFNSFIGHPLVTDTGIPYITWSAVGGVNGMIIVSCGGLSEILLNQQLEAADALVHA
jgi:hypothetical protein